MSNTMNGTIERKALVANIQKYNMHDGPGVRTLVFFKGCPLRCQWCSNPESLEKKYAVMYKRDSCVNCGACVPVCPVGIHTMMGPGNTHEVDRCTECIGCRKCEEVCPGAALSISGETKSISELLEAVEADRMFYEMSGGGVTVGGGDPIFQPEAVRNFLMACKNAGINTAMETSGYTKTEILLKMAEFTDLFLYDIKHIDSEKHYELTGVRNEQILKNLKELFHKRHNVVIRMPLLKGLNDGYETIMGTIEFLMPFRDLKNFKGIDLLPYHRMGVNKYTQLGMKYPLEDVKDLNMSSEDMARVEKMFLDHNFQVQILRH
ncbi:MAG: choline TMA-lyase-activating enzyme [Anaerovoracaceae bacterium]|jgi:choline TMA-lyase-activating enzyme